jgi:hypothetical protein
VSKSVEDLAREAGCNDEFIRMAPDWLERFAALVRDQALEDAYDAAIKVSYRGGNSSERAKVTAFDITTAIRALKAKG